MDVLKRELPRGIVEARRRRGWSQQQLCRESGVARSTLSDLEGGLTANLRVLTLLKLCRALNAHPCDLGLVCPWARNGKPCAPLELGEPIGAD